MNLPEQMYSDLKDQIPALKEALETGATYATDVGQRIIQYDIITNAINLLCYIILFFFMCYGFKKHWKWCKNVVTWESNESISILVWMLSILPLIKFLVDKPITKIIKAIFLPEWRLIEILSALIQ